MITLSGERGKKVRRVAFETPVYKVMLVQDRSVRAEPCIHGPEDAAKVVINYLRGVDREHFVGLYLNGANRIIGIHTITIGILNSSLVHPREVFKPAILSNATGIILAHNHPSGDPEPSLEDRRITNQIAEAGRLLGIPLLDHIIIGENRYFSFKDEYLI